jgi:retron-type reverse transcriptase
MIRHRDNSSESWKTLPWKKFRRNLFRLQKRVYKAVQVGDKRKAKSLQKLILKSTAARLLAIRQVSQLNASNSHFDFRCQSTHRHIQFRMNRNQFAS